MVFGGYEVNDVGCGVFVSAMFADWLDWGWQKGALVYARLAKVHPDMAPEITCMDGETEPPVASGLFAVFAGLSCVESVHL